MKLIRKLILACAVLLVFVLAGVLVAYYYASSDPDFYTPYSWEGADRSLVNQQAFDKYIRARAKMAAFHAREAQARRGTTTQSVADSPKLTIDFTEEELNALLLHNSAMVQGFKEKYEKFVTNPGIFLRDGHLILAAQVKEIGYLISMHFEPKLDDNGKLNLKIVKVLGGRLPLPQALIAPQLEKLRATMASRLPAWRKEAKLDAAGAANGGAVRAGMTELLLHVLAGEPAEPILFIDVEGSKSLPMVISEISITPDRELRLTLSPVPAEEREKLLATIRGETETAAVDNQ